MELQSLTPHVFWSLPDAPRDRPILGAVVGRRGTLLVDAGASPAHAVEFLAALAARVDLTAHPPRFAALTHWHWDHVFGLAALGVPTLAHRETHRRMAAMARLDWRDGALDRRVAAGEETPFIAEHLKLEISNAERANLVIALPDLTFDDAVEVDLDGITCQVIHVGGDHSPDSCVVFIPQERTVFLGDCLYSGFGPDGYLYTPARLFPLLDTLTALDAETYLLAHQPTPFTHAQLAAEADLFHRLGAAAAEAHGDRSAAISALTAQGVQLNEDRLEDLDALILGQSHHPDFPPPRS
jgi:glyoxylase-like metal-dependent hydrolase (beta-lactamase superfamily II)